MVDHVQDDFSKPFMISPRMTWSRIGIQVLCREAAVLQDCSAKKEVAPKVVVDLWIGKKIKKGGEKKKSKRSRVEIFLQKEKAIRVGLQRVFRNWADSSSRWTILPLISYVWWL